MRKLKSSRPSVKSIGMDNTSELLENGDADHINLSVMDVREPSYSENEEQVNKVETTTEEEETEDVFDKLKKSSKKGPKGRGRKSSNGGSSSKASRDEEDDEVENKSDENEEEEDAKPEESKNEDTESDAEEKDKEDSDAEFKKEDSKPLKSKQKKSSKKKGKKEKKEKKEIPARVESDEGSGDDQEEKEEDEKDYEVEKILDEKKIKGVIHYKVRWKGYAAEYDTWEPVKTLQCDELISEFKEARKEKGSSKKKGSPKKGSPKRGRANKRQASRFEEDIEEVIPKKTKRGPPTPEDGVYEVEELLEASFTRNGNLEFLVRWKGYDDADDSLEPIKNLNCPEMMKEFLEKIKKVTEDTLKMFDEGSSKPKLVPKKAAKSPSPAKKKKNKRRY